MASARESPAARNALGYPRYDPGRKATLVPSESRLARRRVRPGFSLDELDRVARRVTEIDGAPACIVVNLVLELDPSLAKGGRERIEGTGRDREGDMPGPFSTMGRDGATWP